MILQSLYRDAEAIARQIYGDKNGLPPPMYQYQPLAFVIEIDADTGTAALTPLPQGDPKKNERPRTDCLPYLGRTSAVVPILLTDKPAYVLGIDDGKADGPKPRNEETRKAFRDLVALCFEETRLPDLAPVLRFLDRWDPAKPEFPIPVNLRSNDLIGFRVRKAGGDNTATLSDHLEVRAFWASYTRSKDARLLECLVTGETASVESKLPLGIKNVPGGQSSGAALSSFNENAYMSYGMREYSAPISRDAAEQFGKALNALLISKEHHTVVGPYDSGIAYVYWSPNATPPLPLLAARPDPEIVEALSVFAPGGALAEPQIDRSLPGDLLKSPVKGAPIFALADPDAPFHILGLSSHSGGRVVIRSALTLSVRELFERQGRWFGRLRQVHPSGERGRPLSIPHLAAAAYRDRKEVTKSVIEALVQTALTDTVPPWSLLPAAVRRCQIGSSVLAVGGGERREHVTYERAVLIKFLLTWNNEEKAYRMSDFDPNEENMGYRCGRLLSHLERIQYLALGKINATLVDRYYGGASTTPRAVFPPLLRLANQAHLPTIRREPRGGGRAFVLQNELAAILEPIGFAFPRALSLEEQGSFALGYYHQRAKTTRESAAARERRNAAGASTDVPAVDFEDAEDSEDLLYSTDTPEKDL